MKRRVSLYILLGIVAVLTAVWYLPGLRYHPSVTAEQMDAMIRKELPAGTARADVSRFLDAQKIEYSFVNNENKIYAIIRNTCRGILVECSIDMVFGFNEQGALTSTSVKEGLTGP
jgi:hypothetical protein